MAAPLVLVAPDSFKGTFTAREVAGALGSGLAAAGCAVDTRPVADGGAGALAAIAAGGGLRGVRLVVLCDVTTPFERAAEVFGPQKGADPAAVVRLTARLHAQAAALPRDPRGVPRTGAAGGLSGGLWAALGAELVDGAGHVLDLVGADARLARADAAVTGEGQLDEQSFAGKLVGSLAARAHAAGVALHVVAGRVALPPGA